MNKKILALLISILMIFALAAGMVVSGEPCDDFTTPDCTCPEVVEIVTPRAPFSGAASTSIEIGGTGQGYHAILLVHIRPNWGPNAGNADLNPALLGSFWDNRADLEFTLFVTTTTGDLIGTTQHTVVPESFGNFGGDDRLFRFSTSNAVYADQLFIPVVDQHYQIVLEIFCEDTNTIWRTTIVNSESDLTPANNYLNSTADQNIGRLTNFNNAIDGLVCTRAAQLGGGTTAPDTPAQGDVLFREQRNPSTNFYAPANVAFAVANGAATFTVTVGADASEIAINFAALFGTDAAAPITVNGTTFNPLTPGVDDGPVGFWVYANADSSVWGNNIPPMYIVVGLTGANADGRTITFNDVNGYTFTVVVVRGEASPDTGFTPAFFVGAIIMVASAAGIFVAIVKKEAVV